MLKFYYNPVSVNAHRVWVALLEKQIPFDPILVNLDGDQFHDDFTAGDQVGIDEDYMTTRLPKVSDEEAAIALKAIQTWSQNLLKGK